MSSVLQLILICTLLQFTFYNSFAKGEASEKELFETDDGEMTLLFSKINSGGPQSRASTYYLSKKAVTWRDALRYCRSEYGADSTLLFIETEDEFDMLNVFFISTPDTGYRYWTGGRYNATDGNFVWGSTRLPVDTSFVPWDKGHPKMNIVIDDDESVIRVALIKPNYGDVRIQSEDSRTFLRYICEVYS